MTTTQQPQQPDIRPFTVAVPEEALDDLRARLARTRYPEPAPGDDWTYGTPTSYLRDMVARWQEFDWRAQEARINSVPNFVTEIDGQPIHFVHVRSEREDATPILLLHTYPGSFVEFLDLVPLLSDDFHLVIPSMPGVGFSTPLVGEGWTHGRVAATYDALMRRLGYDSYGAHGSDMGALVARELGVLAPEGFLGLHVLQLFSFPSGDPAEFESFGPKDYAALEFMGWFQSVGGYNQMNATRPQTIAAALSDSPVGQLAYNELFENFGNGTSLVKPDQVLTQVSLYWLTNTSATSVRYYHEEQKAGAEPLVNRARTGVAVFADDFKTIRPLAERDNTDIVHWSEYERGGHFAALEVPENLAGDLRVFFG